MAGVVLIALLAPAGTAAQAPGSPPHQFFGSASDGSGAIIDGAPAPDGRLVSALNEAGNVVANAVIVDGLWFIGIDPDEAAVITLYLDGFTTGVRASGWSTG